jgi:hypothetical protein
MIWLTDTCLIEITDIVIPCSDNFMKKIDENPHYANFKYKSQFITYCFLSIKLKRNFYDDQYFLFRLKFSKIF